MEKLRLVLHVVGCALCGVRCVTFGVAWTSQARQKREDVDYDSIESMDVELVNTHLCKLIQVTRPLLTYIIIEGDAYTKQARTTCDTALQSHPRERAQ